MENKNEFEMIGLVDEQELLELCGAAEVNPRTTVPCAVGGATVAITIYGMDRSHQSCPTSACSSRCAK
ncbi:class II lanthipeptide, LchA2/BrtA2 family [Bacillus thuringiensis]|uniref:class II lanthipeptide, LchA2/BrtA2 family n=1 Tax=Bacillus thuringiensis TaxID=1428 RepID=UPI003D9FCB99